MKFTVYENSQQTNDLIQSLKIDLTNKPNYPAWNIESAYRFIMKFYKQGACKWHDFQLINNVLSVYLYGKLLFEVTE
jgi:hypothetical protein